jgi:hypothetical protein
VLRRFRYRPPAEPTYFVKTRLPTKLPRLIALGALCGAVVVFVAANVHPIFLDGTFGTRVARAMGMVVPPATSDEHAMRATPWARLPFQEALATPRFLWDRSAFAIDLLGTGKVGEARALALADVAVREAYRRRVPPALVLGVLLTENDELKSTARSRQGAIGLMQIHPGPWRSALGELFGTNLRNDTTNLRYGIYILSHFAKRSAELQDTSWRVALLHYNGCSQGTHTPDCHRYPEMVRREVQRSARISCAGRDFDGCVVTPLRLGMRGATD